MNGLSIGEIARAAGVAPSAIRYYEDAGLLPAPERANGRRRYDGSTVQRLLVIHYAQAAGFTLGEIRELFFGFAVGTHPNVRWEALAQRKLEELTAQMARIEVMRGLLTEGLRCGCLTMEQCTVWLSGRKAGDVPSPSPRRQTARSSGVAGLTEIGQKAPGFNRGMHGSGTPHARMLYC